MGTDRIRPLYLEAIRANGYSPHTNPNTGRQMAKEAGGNSTHKSTTLGAKYGGSDLTRKAVERSRGRRWPAEWDPRGRVFPALRSLWRF